MTKMRTLFILTFLVLSTWVHGQFYYGLHQTFGKNRVEYTEFDWRFMRYDRFDVYNYEDGRDIAEQVARMVSRQIPLIERTLDVPLDERIQVMVFNNLSDLKQSNLNASGEEAYNTGGVTHFDGSRMFVYSNGDYTHLENQIREGLAGLALTNLIYGGFTQNLRNSTLLNLPEWYMEGLLAYIAYPYTAEVENYIIDGMAHDDYKHLYALSGDDARMAGHSLWHYIAQTYGQNNIKNIVFTTINERSVDRGLQYILGVDAEELIFNWKQYYTDRYEEIWSSEYVDGQELRRSRRDERMSRPVLSPDGRHLAYVTNRLGKYKVRILDVEDNRRSTALRGGHLIAQNADYSYPLAAWHPNGKILAILTEEESLMWLYFYNVETDELEKREFFGFQKVTSLQYSQDGRKFLMSAVQRGQSDIYLYTILSRTYKRLTNDGFTDLEPIFVNNDRFVVFRSNRTHDTLKAKEAVYIHPEQFDLFIYRFDRPDDQVLWRLSTPSGILEYQPQSVDKSHFTYLASGFGPPVEYMVRLDSSIAYVDTVTHYNYSIEQAQMERPAYGAMGWSVNSEAGKVARVYLRDGRYRIGITDLILPTDYRRYSRDTGEMETLPDESVVEEEKLEIDLDNYAFDTEALKVLRTDFNNARLKTTAPVANMDSLLGENFPLPPNRNYFLTFMQDEFTVQVDNVFDYPQYQPFTGTPNTGLINTGFNSLFKLGVIDLMNDYRIFMGFRTDFQPIPGISLSPNSELYFGFVNNHDRLNKTTTLYRRSQLAYLEDLAVNVRYLTYEGIQQWDYPFSEVASLRFSAGWRNQRRIILLDNVTSLIPPEEEPVVTTDYGILKLAYVYDDTRKKGVNLYHGTRYKVFTEYYENFSESNTGMVTAGIDFRHYMPVHREIIWANRFAFGTSFGNELLLHYLGGVDNQFVPGFTNNTPYDQDANYAFQTVVTNMRGFNQNIRNGTSFAVINSELRVPLVKYLFNAPIQNDFLANFQVIGFGDLGTAWSGLDPYSDDNPLNTRTVTNPPSYEITFDTQRDPLVGGFGFGLRSRLLGYFLRVDWAWGVEDGRLLDRVFYFSLSTDF